MISIIVPAHNEERAIGRCLSALLADARPGELEIVVVCNGCSDRTAEAAGRFGPPVRVIETPVASKTAALNLGDEVASGFPRFYVDADVEFTTQDLREVAEVLQRGDALFASPRLELDLRERPRRVRAYYSIWRRLPSVHANLAGCGVYAVSEVGRQRFGRFPDIIADDLFAQQQFKPSERRRVMSSRSLMRAPRTFSALVQRKVRVFAGNEEHAQFHPAREITTDWAGWLDVVRERPALCWHLPVFLCASVVAKVLARVQRRRGTISWGQDETSRA
ncbi:MAG: glycosyltransferase [Actinomycetota bacterium]|nr:glycosyltransferase [Actinomycetota bacterium]